MKKDLDIYNDKRDFKKTREPRGVKRKSKKKLRFVVQHHLARKDHYDFRLEWDGVLKSWAVPKGPSYNPRDKRLAILVEDHPLSYRNFEGTIPKGEYGGGTVMIFDEGFWLPIDDRDVDFTEEVLKFELKGERLKGVWSLVHFKDDNWLLIKDEDGVKGFRDIKDFGTSIKSGRTMDEIARGEVRDGEKFVVMGVEVSNPGKLAYERPDITKGEVVNYYYAVAQRMMPYLQNRIISTVRVPDGARGRSFFMKHFEGGRKGLRKIKIRQKNGKQDDYYFITEERGLISEANMNSIEFHIWGSCVGSLRTPNMMVFDLDPDEGLGIRKLREGVRDLKKVLDGLGLSSFLKTSGGKGYHVVVPVSGVGWKEFRSIAKNIALLMERNWPAKYTSNIRKEARKGKIFIDWLRNTKGATSIAPYSLRARDKATVSMPISWSQLNTIKPDGVTMSKALKMIDESDPWEELLSELNS